MNLMDNLFWKNTYHMESFKKAMDRLEADFSDGYYCSFAYLLSATGKVDYLLEFLSRTGISSEEIKEAMKPYSRTEKNMILFALQLFNNEMSDITLPDVIAGLDSSNYKCVLEAIQIRFGKTI